MLHDTTPALIPLPTLRLYWVVPTPFVSRRITAGPRFGKLEGFTQASRVIPAVGFRALLEGTITPELEAASKWKACSTSPVGKVTTPVGVPLFSPRISLPFPSPGHQATMPGGGGIQVMAAGCGARTSVSWARALRCAK